MQTVIFRYAEHSIGGGYGVDASTGAKGVDGAAEGEYVRLADHNARVAELEQLAATRNEAIGNLRNELSKAQAQNVQIADSLERVMRERDLAQERIKELEGYAERLSDALKTQIENSIELLETLTMSEANRGKIAALRAQLEKGQP